MQQKAPPAQNYAFSGAVCVERIGYRLLRVFFSSFTVSAETPSTVARQPRS